MSGGAVTLWRLALAGTLLLGAAAGVQRLTTRSMAPAEAASQQAQAPALNDSGEVIDFDHLREADLNFLDGVLREGTPAGQRSAIRALLIAEDLRGARLLLRFAADTEDEDAAALSCVAALEVLRLHRRAEVQRALLVALERREELPKACVIELRDRFSLIHSDVRALADAPEPEARRYVARSLEDDDDSEASDLLLVLAADADPSVRRTAWLAWQGRGLGAARSELSALAAAETDPDTQRLAAAALEPR